MEDLNLIDHFFHPLQAEIKQGRYDYKIVKAWHSATNLLDLKVQALLDRTLQKGALKTEKSPESEMETLSSAVHLFRPIRPLERPIAKTDLTKAYIELMIHRKKRRLYSSDPERMSYDPIEIEPVSIEIDKDKLLQKLRTFKKSTINFPTLLEKRTWQEALEILNILLHLAHEGKIKLHQDNFPDGKILITYNEAKN